MARFVGEYIKVSPGAAIRAAEGVGADNSDDFNVHIEPCNTVAKYVESYHDKGYYLPKDLEEMNGLIKQPQISKSLPTQQAITKPAIPQF